MTITIQNADDKLLDLLTLFKKSSINDYKIYDESDIYNRKLLKSLKKDEKELKKLEKAGLLKRYNSVEEAFEGL